MFDNLAILVIELKERIQVLEARLRDLQVTIAHSWKTR
ncbi:hypothetical protein KR51_00005850 [Rubidibacter lacunae KORDI 51-2]|uniref:Uncharacterized protein n=1 Tax=Rubidibacter lacunae KORDI 51-2 TaxID=582515 RepID=U5DPF8_9CHRO|nr:hypothetical protein KR51_00005850 [Rubidibacter lacunae KORDI 51-2]